jgi:hypothetical protein
MLTSDSAPAALHELKNARLAGELLPLDDANADAAGPATAQGSTAGA